MKVIYAILCMALTLVSTQAEQIIKDGFDQISESKVPLASAVTETGNRVWEATPNVRILKEGSNGVIGIADEKSFGFRLALPTDSDVVELEAQVHPTSNSGSETWISVGIGNSSINPKTINIAWGHGVFVLLSSTGRYQCLFNPTTSPAGAVQIQGGPAPGFKAEGFNRIKIEYRRGENKVSMYVNDQKVLSGFNLEKRGFTPDAAYAGVTGYGQTADQQSVDNVVLTLQP